VIFWFHPYSDLLQYIQLPFQLHQRRNPIRMKEYQVRDFLYHQEEHSQEQASKKLQDFVSCRELYVRSALVVTILASWFNPVNSARTALRSSLNRSASFARMVNPAKKTRKTEINNFFIRSKIRVNISIFKLKQFHPAV